MDYDKVNDIILLISDIEVIAYKQGYITKEFDSGKTDVNKFSYYENRIKEKRNEIRKILRSEKNG